MTLGITVYVVALPRMETLNFTKLGILEAYLFVLMLFSRTELSHIIADMQ